ncbi:hypothetical protein L228DRAFT_239331 [Xylona heveae TC161]|uniref:Hemerythrin-like domain-containing protein n=1 Tax=Xylona heveae (strain CBS 132557 / TC161) TaxID=1328760 RepID=A0A165GLY4_XYLHT|nr:hypothetical protein L228DRAFT_239331 [Xylona heveae TC161]KZF22354.1 hypothetical protein L228DRAFT_239331 [Xylona heveae TC161]
MAEEERCCENSMKRETSDATGPGGVAGSSSETTTATTATTTTAQTDALPKLSAKEFREYNRMAEHMDMFHNHFRQTWNTLYRACEAGRRPAGFSIRAFISMGIDLCEMLEMHHGIEEAHVFPRLAARMPAFKRELELVSQHREIHRGLESLQAYLQKCRSGETDLRLDELKEVMDGFGKVLWQHMDDEVKELGAENMRKYWSLEEMRKMRM